ncbi:MAG TPA: sigma-70 family RNA polymerase sigma factor [Pirellulales bacterium]|nr:sigma-70 family RNA polymerase sigma factor [Pirellulales bacterium]
MPSNTSTSVSLIERLRDGGAADAWARFVRLYTPILLRWARRWGMQSADATDLAQDVLLLLVQKLPEFKYDPRRSFRAWLFTLARNRWRDACRRRGAEPAAEGLVDDVAAPDELGALDEAEFLRQLSRRALRLMRAEFQPRTWQAAWEHVVVGRPAAEVAAEMGLQVNTVYVSKARVLRRLREELRGMLD